MSELLVVWRDRRTGDYLTLPLGSRPRHGLAVVSDPLPTCLAHALAQALDADRKRRRPGSRRAVPAAAD